MYYIHSNQWTFCTIRHNHFHYNVQFCSQFSTKPQTKSVCSPVNHYKLPVLVLNNSTGFQCLILIPGFQFLYSFAQHNTTQHNKRTALVMKLHYLKEFTSIHEVTCHPWLQAFQEIMKASVHQRGDSAVDIGKKKSSYQQEVTIKKFTNKKYKNTWKMLASLPWNGTLDWQGKERWWLAIFASRWACVPLVST